MLDIREQYATDENAENEGVWRDLPKGAKVKIARGGNRAYTRELNRLIDLRRADMDAAGDDADKISDEIMAEVLAKTILKDWSGIGANGVETPYSIAEAKAKLAIKDFRRVIGSFADEMEAYRIKKEAEQGKS